MEGTQTRPEREMNRDDLNKETFFLHGLITDMLIAFFVYILMIMSYISMEIVSIASYLKTLFFCHISF